MENDEYMKFPPDSLMLDIKWGSKKEMEKRTEKWNG